MRSIALVGLMGAGKSTVGAELATNTGLPLIDVDRIIETRTGRTVRELWEDGGEAAYRSMESDVVLDALRGEDDVILAVPGGVVLDPVARAALAAVPVVWLRADPSVLGGRVRAGDHRPLLGADPATDLAAMAVTRRSLYDEVATFAIDTDEADPPSIAAEILRRLATPVEPEAPEASEAPDA